MNGSTPFSAASRNSFTSLSRLMMSTRNTWGGMKESGPPAANFSKPRTYLAVQA
jgi:hypothetical protein